ncbi:MAG: rhodanese-like domain-containing protein [Bacteroidota bacterium]|nr:rhodanese-like domain-containing protein [Bacteroidota bacterium]
MKEITRTKRLFIFSILFAIIIIIGLLTMKRPHLTYQLSPEEALTETMSLMDEYFPEDIPMLVEYADPAFQLIDIRNPYEYLKGHIETAINIPVYNLLDNENLKFFKRMAADTVTIILYGKDQLEANSPWMLLKQMGYNNIKVLLGGYDYYVNGPLDFYDMPEIPEYLVEEAKYDFADIISQFNPGQSPIPSESSREVVVPVRRKKKNVVEGGC